MTDARNAYRESVAHGASAVGQVILLYEQMVEDLRRAGRAIEENHIEGRTNAINHAMLIVSHLQNKLNFASGGEVARNLERFYGVLRSRLLEAQVQASKDILKEQIGFLLDLRDAWTEVDRAEAARSTPLLTSAPSQAEANASVTDWKA